MNIGIVKYLAEKADKYDVFIAIEPCALKDDIEKNHLANDEGK